MPPDKIRAVNRGRGRTGRTHVKPAEAIISPAGFLLRRSDFPLIFAGYREFRRFVSGVRNL